MQSIKTAVVALALAFISVSVQGANDPIRSVYIHGMPIETASEYAASLNDESLSELMDMLTDPKSVPYWPNVTKVLGITGNPAVVDPLIEFIEGWRYDGEWSSAIYRGRLSAIMALGRFVKHTENGTVAAKVMAYLRDSVSPKGWNDRDVNWTVEQSKSDRIMEQFCITAVIGIALTGRKDELEWVMNTTDNPRVQNVAESRLR